MRQLSITPLTLPTLTPPQFLLCAAQAGFGRVALRILQGSPRNRPDNMPLLVSGAADRLAELRAILDGEGLVVSELEFILLDADTAVEEYRPFLEMGAALGGRYIATGSTEPDLARAAEKLHALSQMARDFGIKVVIEFVRYSAVQTLQDAVALIRASGADNAGILLDTFHFYHAGNQPEDILAYPASLFPYIQLADTRGPRPQHVEEIIRQAREDRLNPGQGQIDLTGIVRNLTPGLPISLEVPNLARIAQIGGLAHATQLRHDTEQLLCRIDSV
jgi:sugar phosphate isomerase/epimerase